MPELLVPIPQCHGLLSLRDMFPSLLAHVIRRLYLPVTLFLYGATWGWVSLLFLRD